MKLQTAIALAAVFTLFSVIASAQNSLNFDGGDDYIKVPYSASHNVTSAVTIESMVYPTSNNWDNILMKGNYGYGFALSGSGGPGSCGSSGNLLFWDQSQCGSTVRSSLVYAQNTWQHVAVTVEDSVTVLKIYFYVNGVQDGPYYSGNRPINNGNSGGLDTSIFIGTQGVGLGNFFKGTMDELRLWNVVRTQSEIQAAMNVEVDPVSEPNLVMYYPFNQGIAGGDNTGLTTALDSTANNNNGTLTNFALNGSTSNWVGQAVLPIQLLSFTATNKAGSIEVNWSTASEHNSNSFEIQRSNDGNNYIPIGTVAAAGNSNYQINYHFVDAAPGSNNYYRIKQIDADGKYLFSPVVQQKISAVTHLNLQGNPVLTKLKAVLFGASNHELKLVIANTSGATIISKTIAVQLGTNEISIPVSQLKPGLYYLQAFCGKWKEVLKFSKL